MAEPSLEALMAQATSDDWRFLEALDQRFGASPESRKAREKAKLDRARLSEIAARIFEGPEGTLFLEWLLDQTVRRMTFAVMTNADPQRAVLYGAFREGQNALALTLLRMIAEGRSEPPPQHKE